MKRWMNAALEYVPRWIDYQMQHTEQPGCAIAIAHEGKIVLEKAFGHADLALRTPLTTKHRFRVASHSKSFTTAGILKLREQGRVQLENRIGDYVPGLHPKVAAVSIGQLLSHTGGLVRDGADAGQWSDRRPFLSANELRADLAEGPIIERNTRFKYSNHGYGLVGLAIESITGEPYGDWIAREVIEAARLHATAPDAPISEDTPFAHGHSAKLPLGRRMVIPGDNPTNALAAATGFVSTASDMARFFASLAPDARKSVLSVDSRREMWRRQWPDPHSSLGRWYGLGTICGTLGDWEWFGHTGGFQGTVTRTACVPAQGLTVSVLTNAADGPSLGWVDGILHILRAYSRNGAPSRREAAWAGRWWSLWGPLDLLPMDGKVLIANPTLMNPVIDATELMVEGRTRGGESHGRIALAGGFASHGESVRLRRDARGRPVEFWLGGTKMLPKAGVEKELRRYAAAASVE
jgi:D-alanyl-D-alanine carboxypeptidase